MEPFENLMVEVPSAYQGVVIEQVGKRKGHLLNMNQNEVGEIHLEYRIPTRGLIGLKNLLLTMTKGTAIMNHLFADYEPVEAEIFELPHGSLIASETGRTSSYGLDNAQQRGMLFYGPAVEVYEAKSSARTPATRIWS